MITLSMDSWFGLLTEKVLFQEFGNNVLISLEQEQLLTVSYLNCHVAAVAAWVASLLHATSNKIFLSSVFCILLQCNGSIFLPWTPPALGKEKQDK